ncbi:MAG: sulfotransferase [Acidobacteria bacterium]|nr:sulfotransferase [Acidobacteriota bacterium]
MNQEQSLPPAFILSCARSGSTLLRYIVDAHPAFCSPPELNLAEVCHSLDRAIYHTVAQTSGATERAEKDQIVYREIRRIISGFMNTYAEAKGKRNWCEKSPFNLHHLPSLYHVFPDAKYLCLYRNAMDVVSSMLDFNRVQLFDDMLYFVQKNNGNMVDAMIECWITRTSQILDFERQHGAQCFHITYESIVCRPSQTLEAMFSFLGVEWQESLLDSVFSAPHDIAGGDPKIVFSDSINSSSLGKGATISRGLISEAMLKRMNALLEELEYPPVGVDWDTAPSPFSARQATEKREDVGSVEEVFENVFPERIRRHQHALRGTRATCQIAVTGEESGVWLIELNESDSRISKQEREADCLIRIAANHLLDIVNGKLNVAAAMQRGYLRINGEQKIAMMLGRVLFGAISA